MRINPMRYIVVVGKAWLRAISGPVLALFSLILLVMQLAIKDVPILRHSSWATLALAGFMVFVAQYDLWKEQYEARVKAEADGPEVQLSYPTTDMYAGFFVQVRNGRDVIKVSFDPIETAQYRVESETLSFLPVEEIPKSLPARVIHKTEENAQSFGMDLDMILRDASNGFACSLKTILRYRNAFGLRFKRRITIDTNRVFLAQGIVPDVVNHEIEPDHDVTEAL
jgi:hypothetical protein